MRQRDFINGVLFVVAGGLFGCNEDAGPSSATSQQPAPANSVRMSGSKSCRECHAKFYKSWSTSWHSRAMQPFTPEFAKSQLALQAGEIRIGASRYRVERHGASGCVRAFDGKGEREYPIVHVMGGKSIYYFLTPGERGRLQVLPLAYDVHRKAWCDVAANGLRHFVDRREEALPWTDRLFTFNASCLNCHVTDLATNYDPATDSYRTKWSEPGISCESCHGPGMEHLKAMAELGEGKSAVDIKIIRPQQLAATQINGLCAACHAKLWPISVGFWPGEQFFDHFDLVTWEHPDFYADGRDLGENYTYTSWLTSRCEQAGKLSCNHCHTPSGRMRFSDKKSNQACLPCHQDVVNGAVAHGHHKPGSQGNRCFGCHMPTTRFAAMARTDHSMRPPTPASALAFQSPNACNVCHADRDAAWSNKWVGRWYRSGYQSRTIRRAELIDAARKQRWDRVPEMLNDLEDRDSDQVYKTSLVRLLGNCEDKRRRPVLLRLLHDSSPLVRSSAVTALGAQLSSDVVSHLIPTLADPSRLVRIRAASVLVVLRPESLGNGGDRSRLEKANAEFLAAMRARSDDWASHVNLGNHYMEKGDFPSAVKCFEMAAKLEPRQIGPWVNAAMAHSNLSRNDLAEQCLRRALRIEPENAAANYNLGLLLAEQGNPREAEQALRRALKSDPKMAAAAYNLSILVSGKNLDEAIRWCQRARELRPDEPKYAYTLAYYLHQKAKRDQSHPPALPR